jgi:hypothetical protein
MRIVGYADLIWIDASTDAPTRNMILVLGPS